MTHRAESIMAAVLANITGLATTGTRVTRGRPYPLVNVPALTLEMGDDLITMQNIRFIDRELNINITAHIKTSAQYDTLLNTIREQVHIALMANRTQGLPAYVLDTLPLGESSPELSGDADEPTAQQLHRWQIKYRHDVFNPGA